MLPNCCGATKIPKIPVSKGPPTAVASEVGLCVRCSRSSICVGTKNSTVLRSKGRAQCRDYDKDKALRQKCRICGSFTSATTGVQASDTRIKSVDPRTMSPEELTELELTNLLNRFKVIFQKKSKLQRTRLNHITSQIIEILNPNLVLSYKKCGRMNRKKIEEHFYRTSEKFEHTFEWHKAALDFVMDRIINLDFYETFHNIDAVPRLKKKYKSRVEILDHAESFEFQNKSSLSHEGGKRFPKPRITFKDMEDFNQELLLESYERNIFPPEMIKRPPLIVVKPTKWLIDFTCPHCRLKLRLSDFSKHFAEYHCLPIVCMDYEQTKQIRLDPKTLLNRCAYPHTLFLVKNVVRDLGGGDYRNFFPIVLIVTSTRSTDPQPPIKVESSTTNFFRSSKFERKQLMFWLSGIPLSNKMQVCLRVITIQTKKEFEQSLMINKIYPITGPQRPKDVHESGAVLLLSPETLMAITNNGVDSIVLEISIRVANTAWVTV